MKPVLVFLILFAFSLSSFAQKDADLSEDIAALRNDIKDIEAEIADAKINYPEDVP
jgi:outer membrane lipoprotein-sorting protein